MTPHDMLIEHVAASEGAQVVGFHKAMRKVFADDEEFGDWEPAELRDALRFVPDLFRLWREPGVVEIYEVVDGSAITKEKLARVLQLFDVLDSVGYELRLHVINIDGTLGTLNLGALWFMWCCGDFDAASLAELLVCAQFGDPPPNVQAVMDRMGVPSVSRPALSRQ